MGRWGRENFENGGFKDWTFLATSQGMLPVTRRWKKQGKDSPQSFQQECDPAKTLILVH